MFIIRIIYTNQTQQCNITTLPTGRFPSSSPKRGTGHLRRSEHTAATPHDQHCLNDALWGELLVLC